MITIGIHDGHTATACIAKDGEILACISEERLVRKKEWGGFPKQSIKWCLDYTGILPPEIEGVGVVGIGEPTIHKKIPKLSLGKSIIVKKGKDLTLLSIGNMLSTSLDCAHILEKRWSIN